MAEDQDDAAPSLNDSDDPKDFMALGCLSRHYETEPDLGLFVIDTRKGHYSFIIDVRTANYMIQALRDFIAGNTDPLEPL